MPGASGARLFTCAQHGRNLIIAPVSRTDQEKDAGLLPAGQFFIGINEHLSPRLHMVVLLIVREGNWGEKEKKNIAKGSAGHV